MADLISVIVPVYNAERFLERCLDSILIQTHQNLEIIVVNDGSTDGSANIIDRYAEKDSRIITIHQKNAGVSAARNAGLRAAKGTYIGFVDGDDEILPDMYEVLLNNLLAHNADISHCGFEWVKSNVTVRFYGTGILVVQTKNEGLAEILSGKRIEPGIWNKLYHKSTVRDVQFPDGIKHNEDLLFNVYAFSNAQKSVFNDVVKYRYMQNFNSASQSGFSEKAVEDAYEVTQRIRKKITDKELNDNVHKFYAAKLMTLLQGLHRNRSQYTALGKKLKKEASTLHLQKMGFRLRFLQTILTKLPFMYGSFRFGYDLLTGSKKKWSND